MATKAFEGPAFGSQSARFNLNGIHPNLLSTGKMPYDSKNITESVIMIMIISLELIKNLF
jgi:hypothetical protein